MLKVCLDTNVWISGLVSTGLPSKLIAGALAKQFQTIISEPILEELVRNLTDKFGVKKKDASRIRYRIFQIADVYIPKGDVKIKTISEQDCFIIETALLGKANYLVTGDRAILELRHYKYFQIVEPSDFFHVWKPEG